MMNRTLQFLLLTFFFNYTEVKAQKISLEELQIICNNKNFESTNKLLLARNYEFNKTEKTEDNMDFISWTFDQTVAEKSKNLATFSIFSFQGTNVKGLFNFRGKEIYASILNDLPKLSYVFEKEVIEDGNIISNYISPNFYIKLSFKKTADEPENNQSFYTAYEIQISKKGGIDDPNNGLKIELYDNGKPKLEYTLKDGKSNGAIKYFNEDGTVAKSGFMVMGLEKGTFTEFIYEKNSGVIKQKEFGEMLDGKKKGKWLLTAVNNDKESNLTYTNYVNGLKEGSFSKIQNDSICFGYYKNDLLDGKYEVYTSQKDLELGTIIDTDTLHLKKVIVGFFSDNKKNGLWKIFDVDGTLTSEGNFENDRKTGKWRRFYSIYVDDNDKEMDYSGQLFLEENFKDGKRSGETNRFSALEEIEFPCENDKSKKCTKIDFKKMIEKANYENGLLHGEYEWINDNNESVEKGTYTKGKRTGKWHLMNDSKVVNTNKNTLETGDFVDDKKQGKWERLKNGNVVETYFYSDEALDAEHICFNNGKPKEKRKFQNDRLTALELLDDSGKTTTKYGITDSEESYKCEITEFSAQGMAIRNFIVNKVINKPIDCASFKEDFEGATKIADGFYQKKTTDDKLLEEGNFKNNQKWGKWTTFYYAQKVKTEFVYNENNEISSEFYFDLKANEPFSGEFDLKYDNNTGGEERKIKDGVRNGTTRYKDAKDKTVKKETYKEGVLKLKE